MERPGSFSQAECADGAIRARRDCFRSATEGDGAAGIMVIELPGERRVRVDRHVDADALRRVLQALGASG